MYPQRSTVLILAASSLASAWQIPFFSSNNKPAPEPTVAEDPILEIADPTTRVAIVGAGAGGSSAAFWISLAKKRLGVDIHVDVYERSDYIGGRSTIIYPYDDPTLGPRELGGSVFVSANKNLMRASKEFNLTLKSLDGDDFGVWDGRQFVLTTSGSWWDTAKLAWRYGIFGPKKVMDSVSEFIKTFLNLYTPEYSTWEDLPALTAALNFTPLLTHSAGDYFESKGVYPLFVREVVEASTRVNYAQDVAAIHALEGSVSLASDGAYGTVGGNYQIFEQFLKRSNANIHLKTSVASLTKKEISGKPRWVVETSSGSPIPSYDHVILATPYHLSGITLSGSSANFPPVEYVHLHVTLVSSILSRPDPAYFGVSWNLPGMILTTSNGARNGGPAPEFQSISHHSTFTRDGKVEHVFKIFSLDYKDDAWLQRVFGKDNIGWVHRKEWDSYPKLPPTNTFPPIKADEGLWYVNAFEPWISCMETETLASRNVVDLMIKETFGQGICPTRDSQAEEAKETIDDADKVYGWDC